MSEDKTYTATDLSRYYAGEMSPQEMHALEKAALSDPFLADALEGYAYTPTPGPDIVELKQRLAGKKGKAKLFFLGRENRWMRIAAMLVVFAGAGYFFYRFNSTEKVKTEAVLEQPKQAAPPSADTSPVAVQNETISKANNKTTTTVVSEKKDIPVSTAATFTQATTLPTDGQTFTATAPATEPKRVLKNLRDDEEKENNGNSKIVMADSISFKNNSATTDVSGNMQTITPATTATVSTGFAKKDVKLNNNAEHNIALHKYENQRQTAMNRTNADLKENKALLKKAVESDELTWQEHGKMEPIDSIVFTDYADKNIKAVTDSAGTEYSGKVLLSFTVNKKGQPENIKVDQSLCKPCDEQAVQLLKNGPKWIYVPGKRKQVSVEF